MNKLLSRLLNCVVLLAVPPFGLQRAVANDGLVRLATTTSVKGSGLLAALEPAFTNATGYHLDVQAVGTWLAQRSVTPLQLMVRGDPRLDNPYTVIAVNPERNTGLNYQGARALVHWLLSSSGQALIRSVKVDNEQLFLPVADFDSDKTAVPVQPDALPGARPAD